MPNKTRSPAQRAARNARRARSRQRKAELRRAQAEALEKAKNDAADEAYDRAHALSEEEARRLRRDARQARRAEREYRRAIEFARESSDLAARLVGHARAAAAQEEEEEAQVGEPGSEAAPARDDSGEPGVGVSNDLVGLPGDAPLPSIEHDREESSPEDDEGIPAALPGVSGPAPLVIPRTNIAVVLRSRPRVPAATPPPRPQRSQRSSTGRRRREPRVAQSQRRPPCLACLKSALSGKSLGVCYNTQSGPSARCLRCSSGHSCRPM